MQGALPLAFQKYAAAYSTTEHFNATMQQTRKWTCIYKLLNNYKEPSKPKKRSRILDKDGHYSFRLSLACYFFEVEIYICTVKKKKQTNQELLSLSDNSIYYYFLSAVKFHHLLLGVKLYAIFYLERVFFLFFSS